MDVNNAGAAEAAQGQKLRIRSAKDIFDALRSDDVGVRLSIVKAIIANPEKAASYAEHDGTTLVDYLIFLLHHNTDPGYKLALLAALASFSEERITNIFKSEMLSSDDDQTITMAASKLAAEPEADVRGFLATMLKSGHELKARHAANIMAGYETLGLDEKVMIAVHIDADFPAPALNDETERTWLKELVGPALKMAGRLIEEQGEEAFLRLKEKWASLPNGVKEWLLDWGARRHQAHTVQLLIEALKEDALLPVALRAIGSYGEAASIFKPLIAKLASHPDRAVRLTAIRAGAECGQLEELIFGEKDIEFRIEFIRRFAAEKGPDAIPQLVEMLGDDDWQIRACAAGGLISIGEPAVDAVEPLLSAEDERVRVAAAKVLLSLERKPTHDKQGSKKEDT